MCWPLKTVRRVWREMILYISYLTYSWHTLCYSTGPSGNTRNSLLWHFWHEPNDCERISWAWKDWKMVPAHERVCNPLVDLKAWHRQNWRYYVFTWQCQYLFVQPLMFKGMSARTEVLFVFCVPSAFVVHAKYCFGLTGFLLVSTVKYISSCSDVFKYFHLHYWTKWLL